MDVDSAVAPSDHPPVLTAEWTMANKRMHAEAINEIHTKGSLHFELMRERYFVFNNPLDLFYNPNMILPPDTAREIHYKAQKTTWEETYLQHANLAVAPVKVTCRFSPGDTIYLPTLLRHLSNSMRLKIFKLLLEVEDTWGFPQIPRCFDFTPLPSLKGVLNSLDVFDLIVRQRSASDIGYGAHFAEVVKLHKTMFWGREMIVHTFKGEALGHACVYEWHFAFMRK
ncbi:hypothetical protein T440DRAFT_483643 [Plenodomus tracheiphilus IPT5]|uniref:Uncharacterized protein n=1 Tax=Plenodomus tracheiphilus IPT5 TaxID=1408161 RepID=A0A6A7ASK3_9PLEO|nr:hypothetical protein T440DRAFT_483643 [Plenodomus tracheiphilus IPT5]